MKKFSSNNKIRLRNAFAAFIFVFFLLIIFSATSTKIYCKQVEKAENEVIIMSLNPTEYTTQDVFEFAAEKNVSFIKYDGVNFISYINSDDNLINRFNLANLDDYFTSFDDDNDGKLVFYSDNEGLSENFRIYNHRLSMIVMQKQDDTYVVAEKSIDDLEFFLESNAIIYIYIALLSFAFTAIATELSIKKQNKIYKKYIDNLKNVVIDKNIHLNNTKDDHLNEVSEVIDNLISENKKATIYQHELIANVSHDLRTPLTLINGYTEMMLDFNQELTKDNVQLINDETKRLTKLVNDLLDLSKLSANELVLKKSNFSVTNLINEIITRLNKLNELEGYTIIFDYKNSFDINADESKLSQVIYNLLTNAINYTGSNKKVVIKTSITPKGLLVEIKDSGKGIKKDEIDKIFSRYYHNSKNYNRKLGGIGIGLSITKQILDLHNYEFGVKTSPQGSNFYFYIQNFTQINTIEKSK